MNEQLICRICQNKKDNKLIAAREMFLGIKESFDYIFCNSCGSLSIKTIPVDIKKYYENYYSLNKDSDYSDTLFRKILKYILISSSYKSWKHKLCSFLLNNQDDLRIKSFSFGEIQKTDAILDVGCGSGDFLNELSFFGYKNLTGIDAFIQKDLTQRGYKIYKKNIFEIEGKYKIIMFHHSLEHMEDLSAVLMRVYDLLENPGICLIRIPNVDSFSFKKFQGSWFSIHAPFHYILPSLKGMQLFAKQSNLHIQKQIGEQLYYFFLLSINHLLGISDYDELGIRRYLESEKKNKNTPPLYTLQEIRYWKKKSKAVFNSGSSDWTAYFLTKGEYKI